MFTRLGHSKEYTLLQQSPSSPLIDPDTPTTPENFLSPYKPPNERSYTRCKTHRCILFVSLSLAALVLVIYPIMQFFGSEAISLPSGLRFGQPMEMITTSLNSSLRNGSAFPALFHRPAAQAEALSDIPTSAPKTSPHEAHLEPSSSQSPSTKPLNSAVQTVSTAASPNLPQSSLSQAPPPPSVVPSVPLTPSNTSSNLTKAPANLSASGSQLTSPDLTPPKPSSAPSVVPSKTLCDYCGCSSGGNVSRTFNQADRLGPAFLDPTRLTTSQHLAPSPSTRMMGQIWASIRDVYCQHPLLSADSALRLLENTRVDSPNLSTRLQWNLSTILPSIPTQYVFTKTSRLGRTNALRPDYFRRHSKTINTHLKQVRERGTKYFPETEAKWGTGPRQLIWILVEDGEDIVPEVEHVIRESQIPFIYVAYGSTNRFGNAQQNAAYAIIHRLSHSVLGHGPIVSIDDDAKFLPELLDLAWRVKRLGVVQMGNLGPTGWEGPTYDPITKKILHWQKHKVDNRKFPLDNGAFVFSTEVLGTGKLIGPRYWPTDYPGGESEFVSLILSKIEEVEPLCYNCHVAWHNQRLTPDCIAHSPKCLEFDVPVKPSSTL